MPDGWHLCDGTSGTPDLRGRFVLGTSDKYSDGRTGGYEKVTLEIEQIPRHRHAFYSATSSASGYIDTSTPIAINSTTGSIQVVQTTDNGSSKAHENMPPYYALAYIMKL